MKPGGLHLTCFRAVAFLVPVLALQARGYRMSFQDVTDSSGIQFQTENGASTEKLLPETIGSGLGFLDFDGDGLLDLIIVNGGARPGSKGSDADRLALYRNLSNGKFKDWTEQAGLSGDFNTYGMGVAAADYDNDGWTDLLLTGYPRCVLFHNNRDGTFTDVTAASGVGNEGAWGTSAGWFDYDRDGWLDLVIANYVDDFSWDRPVYCGKREPGYRTYCTPEVYRGTSSRLYRNLGKGAFLDVTASSGILTQEGKCLGLVLADFDNDGWDDIFVANDGVRNFIYFNEGDGNFQERGLLAGVALSEDGKAEAGMGVGAADVDGDLLLDLYLTHLPFELNRFYRNNGDRTFADKTYSSALGRGIQLYSGFGTGFSDFDNSTRQHLLVVNGHILDNASLYYPRVSYRQPMVLFENDGQGRFQDVSGRLGELFTRELIGRGLAMGDFDNDGLVDFAVSQNHGQPLLVKNTSLGGRWIQLKLQGTGKSNRDAVGAKVTLLAGGTRQYRQVMGGGSYCSAHDSRLHFGLGGSTVVEQLHIRWPSGADGLYRGLPVDSIISIMEGKEPVFHASGKWNDMSTRDSSLSKETPATRARLVD